jgi:hypothetical protein
LPRGGAAGGGVSSVNRFFEESGFSPEVESRCPIKLKESQQDGFYSRIRGIILE